MSAADQAPTRRAVEIGARVETFVRDPRRDAHGPSDERAGNDFAGRIGRWSQRDRDAANAGRDAAMDALVEWLPANIPADDATRIARPACNAMEARR